MMATDSSAGTADITIRATDIVGLWVEDTFQVTVEPEAVPPSLALTNWALAGIWSGTTVLRAMPT